MTLVQKYREQAGLTMVELAARTGMYLSTLWKIEHGQRRLIDHEIGLIAEALGCDPGVLIPTPQKLDKQEEVAHA